MGRGKTRRWKNLVFFLGGGDGVKNESERTVKDIPAHCRTFAHLFLSITRAVTRTSQIFLCIIFLGACCYANSSSIFGGYIRKFSLFPFHVHDHHSCTMIDFVVPCFRYHDTHIFFHSRV